MGFLLFVLMVYGSFCKGLQDHGFGEFETSLRLETFPNFKYFLEVKPFSLNDSLILWFPTLDEVQVRGR